MNETPSNTPVQPTAVSSSLPPTSSPDSPYKGYGGWLTFFCVVQIFIGPLLTLITLAASFSDVGRLSDPFPSFFVLTVVGFIGNIGVMGFGIYVGITLRRLQPGAVSIAKQYLLTRLVWAAVVVIFPFLSGLPSQATIVATTEAVTALIHNFLFFAIWHRYFSVSKRVKATFPEG